MKKEPMSPRALALLKTAALTDTQQTAAAAALDAADRIRRLMEKPTPWNGAWRLYLATAAADLDRALVAVTDPELAQDTRPA